jgi:hypothetical protein
MHGPQGLADPLFLAAVGDLRDGGPRRTVGQSRKYLGTQWDFYGKLLISLAGVTPSTGTIGGIGVPIDRHRLRC